MESLSIRIRPCHANHKGKETSSLLIFHNQFFQASRLRNKDESSIETLSREEKDYVSTKVDPRKCSDCSQQEQELALDAKTLFLLTLHGFFRMLRRTE